jgi:hypothetical protein
MTDVNAGQLQTFAGREDAGWETLPRSTKRFYRKIHAARVERLLDAASVAGTVVSSTWRAVPAMLRGTPVRVE